MSDTHRERRRLDFAPLELFDLVADVRAYPLFIKYISSMRVREDQVEDGQGELVAEALINFKLVRERFVTKVRLDRDARTIGVDYVAGPFRTLVNRWRFDPAPDGATMVDFWIDYEFNNPVLQFMLNRNRNRAVNTLINAFSGRARQLYTPISAN
ncbi:MAG: type II toxin-antitoxin system RatA family toxin [Maricaulaceae bacterium]